MQEDSFSTLGKPKLHSALGQRAYDHIKLRLLEGDLEPEDKLSVVALTTDLGCSRAPVMEALKRLESEGFVEIIPQVGCKVVSPAARDVTDFFVLFSKVEGTIAKFASERRTRDDLATFRTVCIHIDEMVMAAGMPAAHDPNYRRLNLLFHTHIHKMARSPLASGIAAGLWDRSDFYIKMAFGSLYFSSRVKRSHRAIRKAIINGDSDVAEQEVGMHLCAVGESVVQNLEETVNASGVLYS